jgi:ribonuclease J
MNITIHRGTRQIGGSCIELSTANTRIILDIGQELPPIDGKRVNTKPVLPKVNGLYRDDSKGIDAVFISHGHGDHIGLLSAVNPEIPCYMGAKAAKIFNTTAVFIGSKFIVNSAGFLDSSKEIRIGDFTVIPYLVDHSGFDSYAFVVHAEGKCVVYTGDLREHGRKPKATQYFMLNVPKNVNALLMEGTMMGRSKENIATEEEIEAKALDFMSSKNGPVYVLQSSTNIDRLVSMYNAASKCKNIFVMDIFTAHVVSQLGPKIPNPCTFKKIRVFYPKFLTEKMNKEPNGAELMQKFERYRVSPEELKNSKDFCMLIRDSMLADLADIGNFNDAGLIYSMWSGYRKSPRMRKMLEYAAVQGIEIKSIHTSGHAGVDTLRKVVKACSPQRIIPIHTEYPAKFTDIFSNVVLAVDGEDISI